jgi:hypothetical protein
MPQPSIYIRSIRRTPFGAMGGLHKRENAGSLATAVASDLLSGQPAETLVLGVSHAEGLSGHPIERLLNECKLRDAVNALLVLDGERAGFRALELCARSIEMGASCALALAAACVSSLPYLLPEARRGKRMGSSIAQDPLLLGDIPKPICSLEIEQALQKANIQNGPGIFKDEIIGCESDDYLQSPELRHSAANLSQLASAAHKMAPLADGACGAMLESAPPKNAMAQILGIKIARNDAGDSTSVLDELHEAAGLDPLSADHIEIVAPCPSHPQHFANSHKVGDATTINQFGGALAIGYVPGAAGLAALTSLAHATRAGQLGLCFQYGNGWSGGILIKKM